MIPFSVPLAHVVLKQKAPLIMNYSSGIIFMVFWKKAIKDTGKNHLCFSEHMTQAAEKSEEDQELGGWIQKQGCFYLCVLWLA